MGVLVFTSIIFASDTFITLIKQISQFGIPFKIALIMILLNLPAVIVMSIPMGVLLSTVMVLNKLSLASEITVMRSCGISLNRIAKYKDGITTFNSRNNRIGFDAINRYIEHTLLKQDATKNDIV